MTCARDDGVGREGGGEERRRRRRRRRRKRRRRKWRRKPILCVSIVISGVL